MMNEDELGLDTFMKRDGDSHFIHVEQEGAQKIRLELQPEPLTRQRAIVSRGTSCFLTKLPDAPESDGWGLVTKFSWTSDKRNSEADLLRLANQKGVKGIATLVAHCSITSISEMRSGMTFKNSYSFRHDPGVVSPLSSSTLFQSCSDLHGTSERLTRKRTSAMPAQAHQSGPSLPAMDRGFRNMGFHTTWKKLRGPVCLPLAVVPTTTGFCAVLSFLPPVGQFINTDHSWSCWKRFGTPLRRTDPAILREHSPSGYI
ncbi:hypothetical protein VTO42DRAFT_6156 [Malbranchea cinnamomea]